MRSILTLVVSFAVLNLTNVYADMIIVPDDYLTIQASIDAAIAGDMVLVKPGTYSENIDFKGKAITVRSDQGPEFTIIDGGNPADPNYGSVVIFQSGETSTSVLDGFTLTNGTGTFYPPYGIHMGGAIFCNNMSSPIIQYNKIVGNAAYYGGGIKCYNESSPTITQNTFMNNTVFGNFYIHPCRGGAIHTGDYSGPTISHNIISGNIATDIDSLGAGIYTGLGSATISDNTIQYNHTNGNGGGIGCRKTTTVIIINNTITNNTADNSGAGICITSGASPIISKNTISDNTTYLSGGGICCMDSPDTLITKNIILRNNCLYGSSVADGGGIYSSTSSPIITNNIIALNTTQDDGGGLGAYNSNLTIINNTFFGNTAVDNGGGIYYTRSSSSIISNTILWNNSAGNLGGEIYLGSANYPSTLTLNYSDVDGGQAFVYVVPGCTMILGPGLINIDPLFASPGNDDFHLTAPSPCLDVGDNGATNIPSDDFEDDPRIIDGNDDGQHVVDLGADEYHGPPNQKPIADAGADQTVNENVTVTLDGGGSFDPDEDDLMYEWEQIAGPTITLSNLYSSTPDFSAPLVPQGGATLTFQLIVNDGIESSEPDIVNITVKNVNNPPEANAGDDQTVNEGSSVTLDGSGSYDPDDEPIIYLWQQVTGLQVQLSDPTSVNPTFTAPLVSIGGDTLTFSLTVSDNIDEDIDFVDIIVENINHAPVANAGDSQTVDELTTVVLDGTGSSDPDQDILIYSWEQISGPPISLTDADTANPFFFAPDICCGDIAYLTFQLIVDDGLLDSLPDTVTISVRDVNAPPDCSLAFPSKDYLWPPNHKMVSISVLGITDPDDDDVTITVTSVTQDEPVNGLGDGDTSPDAIIQGGNALLRSERSGLGNGRVYRINFTAVDTVGDSCSGYVSVFVPHDKMKPITAIDDGQLYDSTQE